MDDPLVNPSRRVQEAPERTLAGDRMNPRLPLLVAAFLFGSAAVPPRSIDPDTAAWWRSTRFLSSDAMEGRDTGSAGYERAARYVAQRFARAGLKPAGENGTWFQRVNLTEVRVEKP